MTKRKERTCGLHSGYPVCCVEFYISQWRHWSYDEREAYYREAETAFFAKFKDRYLYCLPCPRCLSKSHFMQNRGAPCECLKEHRLEKLVRSLHCTCMRCKHIREARTRLRGTR